MPPVFIYYQVYDDDKKELLSIRQPVVRNNSNIGRVDVTRIPAPHTIGALAERICKQENRPWGIDWDNDDAYGGMLLKTWKSSTAYDLDDEVNLFIPGRPGATPQEPVLLKLWYEELPALLHYDGFDEPEKRSVTSHRTPVFVYYKLYDDTQEALVAVKEPVVAANPNIGRVDVCQIPAPYIVSALAERICKQENREFGLDWSPSTNI
ncbi:hypothetical protein R3P38DRAFT_2766703 [Favolaschia claudopus]|uniref:Uncharacterized protein n=1 Tax=Favolaschia claudopus TaxID=2862362 RepID=A0AAW0D2K6_9AGAR